MQILLENIGKKYDQSWIFKNINYSFLAERSECAIYVVLGKNGSGKSTFLQLLSGFTLPTAGTIIYQIDQKKIEPENIFKKVAVCSPFLAIWEVFTLQEQLKFHNHFKPLLKSTAEITDLLAFDRVNLVKPISEFSSGMKQRLKLALAIFSDVPFLFLDEPCTHLDKHWVQKYQNWLQERIRIFSNQAASFCFVASNEQKEEYEMLSSYKKLKMNETITEK
jgi:ABC-type multidrug transport system ATPase subunit